MENNNLEKIEKEYWGKSFYGSKLNTVLLLVLIVLMIFALRFMYQNQGKNEQEIGIVALNNKEYLTKVFGVGDIWYLIREEDDQSGYVYKKNVSNLPPSRFREAFKYLGDSNCEILRLDPDDGHFFSPTSCTSSKESELVLDGAIYIVVVKSENEIELVSNENTEVLKEYKNDELGFSFSYPAEYGEIIFKKGVSPKGKEYGYWFHGSVTSPLYIDPYFSFSFTTKDFDNYAPGVKERVEKTDFCKLDYVICESIFSKNGSELILETSPGTEPFAFKVPLSNNNYKGLEFTSSNKLRLIKIASTLIFNQSKDQVDLASIDTFMEEEAKWADAEDGLPKGWVRWSDKIGGMSVEKYGPSKTISSYMINLNAGLMSELNGEKKCVGDSELATCVIGNDPEVLRYWNVVNHYY